MLSEFLASKDGIAIFPIASLLVTFGIFLGIVVWAIKMDKKVVSKLERLPFDSADTIHRKGDDSHV